MAPAYTPANMMNAPTGPSWKVTGSSSATVSAGPMPGRMPTTVPSTTPREGPQEVPVLEDDRESLQERRGRFHRMAWEQL